MRSRSAKLVICCLSLSAMGAPAAVSAEEGDLVAFGLPHTALGQAELEINDEGVLVISNLSESGEDGVSIGLGEAQGLFTELIVEPPFEDGVRYIYSGETMTPDGEILGAMETTFLLTEGGTRQLVLNDPTPLGFELMHITVLLDGVPVYQGLLAPGEGVDTPIGPEIGFIHWCLIDCGDTRYLSRYSGRRGRPDPASMVLPDGTEVVGDTIRLSVVDPDDALRGLRTLRALLKAAAERAFDAVISVPHESLLMQNNFHSAMGALRMQGVPGRAVEFAGANDPTVDRVRVDFPDPTHAAMIHASSADADVPIQILSMSARGRLLGEADQRLGEVFILRLSNARGGEGMYQIDADLSDLGSPHHLIQVLKGGEIVAEFPDHEGPIMMNHQPELFGKSDGGVSCYIVIPDEFSIFEVEGEQVPGDELRILVNPADDPVTSDHITAMDLGIVAVGGAPYRILRETAPARSALFDFAVRTGVILDGGLEALRESDDVELHTRSGFGRTFVDAHNMTLSADLFTTACDVGAVEIAVETRISEPAGTMELRVFDPIEDRFVRVATFPIGKEEMTHVWTGEAANVIDPNGFAHLEIKHIVFAPFLAFTFESFIDRISMTAQ